MTSDIVMCFPLTVSIVANGVMTISSARIMFQALCPRGGMTIIISLYPQGKHDVGANLSFIAF